MLAVVLVYSILRKLEIPGALLAAALFAVHPVMVESVAWISEQKNTLSAVFYLTAMRIYLEFDDSRRPAPYVLSFGAFVLGLLSKTVTATLPAALLVIFWWKRGRLSWRRDIWPLVPFFLFAAAAGFGTAWVERKLIGAEGVDFELTYLQRGLLAGHAAWFYLFKLLWPVNLVFIYPRWEIETRVWWQWLFPLAALAATVLLWLLRRRSRAPLAAWLLFVGTLFPALGFFNVYPFIFSFVADHFQYLASLAVFVLAAAGAARVLANLPSAGRAAGITICAFSIVALAVLSFRQARMYENSIALFQTTIDRNPYCWLAHFQLGARHAAAQQNSQAIAHYREALRLRPNYREANNNLGIALMNMGRLAEAIEHLRHVTDVSPEFLEAYNNLGLALGNAGRASEAIEVYNRALQKKPDDPVILTNLGNALTMAGRPADAKEPLTRAAHLKPDYADIFNSLGVACARSGDAQQSIGNFRRAIAINPQYAIAHKNLGSVLANIGEVAAATAYLEQAIALDPQLADAHYVLGGLLQQSAQPLRAIAHYQAALRLKPDYLVVYGKLVQLFALADRLDEAVAVAQKGVEAANAIGNRAMADELGSWLARQHPKIHNQPNAQNKGQTRP